MSFIIKSVSNGKVLDVRNSEVRNGAEVILWPYHGGNNQQWEYKNNMIYSKLGNYVLDIAQSGHEPRLSYTAPMEAAIKSGTLTMTSPSGAALGWFWISRAADHTKERESLGTGNMADITKSSALNPTTGNGRAASTYMSFSEKPGMIALQNVTFRKQIRY